MRLPSAIFLRRGEADRFIFYADCKIASPLLFGDGSEMKYRRDEGVGKVACKRVYGWVPSNIFLGYGDRMDVSNDEPNNAIPSLWSDGTKKFDPSNEGDVNATSNFDVGLIMPSKNSIGGACTLFSFSYEKTMEMHHLWLVRNRRFTFHGK